MKIIEGFVIDPQTCSSQNISMDYLSKKLIQIDENLYLEAANFKNICAFSKNH